MLGLLIATATALILAPAAAAQAEPYPAEPPASSVSDGEVSDGSFVIFSGKGFLPSEQISIEISYNGDDSTASLTDSPGGFVLAALPERRAITVRATAEGTFSVRLRLTEVGSVTLIATGLQSGVTVTENVTVVAAADGDGDDGDNNADGGNGNLPTTGSDGSVLAYTLYGGFGAILIGAGVIWLARSRRRTTEL
jgi:hypothetical protein